MFKRRTPVLPDWLYPFVLKQVKISFPSFIEEKKHDLTNEAHCAAIIMEGLIKVPPDEMNDAIRDALTTAKVIYEREVMNLQTVSPEDMPQTTICLARLACNVLLMRPPSKRHLFKKKKEGEA
ncbi:MAG TPA: hypothetical protein VJ579_00250 [Candidatus Paceibacterota bacterium]|nr:hypothetical protein [Candidatus Paceibacterota bacterium]